MRPELFDFSEGLPVKMFSGYVGKYPYHWHDTMEIVQVRKGSVNMVIGDEKIQLKENDIALVNVNELHCISQSENNETLIIQISGEFFRNLFPDNKYLYIYCCSAYFEGELPQRYNELKEHVARLVLAVNGDRLQPGYSASIKNNLTELLVHVTYNFDFLRWGYGTEAFDEKLVQRLRKIINCLGSKFELNPSLKDIAEELDISLYHLSHDIKEKFGSTFLNMLYYSRCEHAAKLLLGTKKGDRYFVGIRVF